MGQRIANEVYTYSRAQNPERAVLAAIAHYADDDGNSRTGVLKLARMAGVHRNTVFECIRELERMGELQTTPRGKRKRAWRIPQLAGAPERKKASNAKNQEAPAAGTAGWTEPIRKPNRRAADLGEFPGYRDPLSGVRRARRGGPPGR